MRIEEIAALVAATRKKRALAVAADVELRRRTERRPAVGVFPTAAVRAVHTTRQPMLRGRALIAALRVAPVCRRCDSGGAS